MLYLENVPQVAAARGACDLNPPAVCVLLPRETMRVSLDSSIKICARPSSSISVKWYAIDGDA